MDTNTKHVEHTEAFYFKILLGLLLLTTVTFIQPGMFLTEHNLVAQMFIAVIKAWLIVMYYMHLKGERLIGPLVLSTMAIVLVFFIIIIGFDVPAFQYQDVSPITKDAYHAATMDAAHAVSTTTDAVHTVSHH